MSADSPAPAGTTPEGADARPTVRLFVCWTPHDDSEPVLVRALAGVEAAKLFVLRDQATATAHDNDWSASQVLVSDYSTGESDWYSVKVTVKAS